MAFIKARLKKLVSDDGNFSVVDGVELGTLYKVDPDTITEYRGFNTKRNRFWTAFHIQADNGALLPLELLELLTD